MQQRLDADGNHYKFELIDIREFDASGLMATGTIATVAALKTRAGGVRL